MPPSRQVARPPPQDEDCSMLSRKHLMLRGARKARPEAHTTPMQPIPSSHIGQAVRNVFLSGALLSLGLAVVGAQNPDKQAFEVIQHGRYMATAADCTACHTAKGGQPFAGGGALETPFGTL